MAFARDITSGAYWLTTAQVTINLEKLVRKGFLDWDEEYDAYSTTNKGMSWIIDNENHPRFTTPPQELSPAPEEPEALSEVPF